MKIIKSILLLASILGSSCTLDLRQDPNAVQPDQGLPSFYLNSMQRNLAGLFNTASTNGAIITRLENSGGSTYFNIFSPTSFDGTWTTAYASILEDGNQLLKYADANGLARHAGLARIISAYTLLLLVDSFGDVPYSAAFQGSGQFYPQVDKQDQLYQTILDLLDRAIADLTTPVVTNGGYLNATAPVITDMYYFTTNTNSVTDYNKWVKLANTLKLKVYLNYRLDPATQATATAGINALIANPIGLISAAGDNFVFHYGTNLTDPDARHPRFVGQYPAGGGAYMSNWLMWHMFHGYGATQNGQPGDPRMRFYFYRQTATNSTDANQIHCITATSVPSHYPQSNGVAILTGAAGALPPGISTNPTSAAWTGLNGTSTNSRTFCYPTDRGYWGRDHVNNDGNPPDNLLRTAWGAYPMGGRFDANVNTGVSASVGMKGAGIQPIMMRSFVQFMLAEATLYLGTTGTANIYFQTGMQNSFDDVRTWSVNGSFGVGTASVTEGGAINAFYPAATYTTDRNNYVTAAMAAYAAQATNNDRMNYIAREYWIALFGNGVESYNLYRRTGMPTGMQPALNPAPSQFPRSFWYPAVFVNLNTSTPQKSDLTGHIFWDKNTSNLDF